MRGLKHFRLDREHHRHESHLLQMRGLKHKLVWLPVLVIVSHLLQMRGLKPFLPPWRERFRRRIFYRCVDWNLPNLAPKAASLGRIFYRCVDWNINDGMKEMGILSRIFYRCVDWNRIAWQALPDKVVASFTDAWIETKRGTTTREIGNVASFTDAWIETFIAGIRSDR